MHSQQMKLRELKIIMSLKLNLETSHNKFYKKQTETLEPPFFAWILWIKRLT